MRKVFKVSEKLQLAVLPDQHFCFAEFGAGAGQGAADR